MTELQNTQMNSLKSNSYDSIKIVRHLNDCYLVLEIEGSAHVYQNQDGSQRKYRNVWQLKEWLKNKFELPTNDILVEKI